MMGNNVAAGKIAPNNVAVELRDLDKYFGRTQVLSEINLTAEYGTVTVIIGPSGSGKSTLLRCINGLEAPTSGTVFVHGNKLVGHNGAHRNEQIRGSVGMVFQNFNLFPHLTVLDNITLAPVIVKKITLKSARETARRLLLQVGLPEKAAAYPDSLSGGQQQRVAIARALAMSPDIMLFDEPTSALDPEMIKEVLDVMLALAKDGMTMLVVSHEMGFVQAAADMIVFLDEGRIVEQGNAGAIFNTPTNERTQRFLSNIL